MVLDEEDAGAQSSLIPSPYFLILDTNIILDQVSIIVLKHMRFLLDYPKFLINR